MYTFSLLEAEDVQEDLHPLNSIKGFDQLSKPSAVTLPLQQRESIQTILRACKQTSTPKQLEARDKNNMEIDASRNVVKDGSQLKNMSFSVQEKKALSTREDVRCPTCHWTGPLLSLEGDRAHQTAAESVVNLIVEKLGGEKKTNKTLIYA